MLKPQLSLFAPKPQPTHPKQGAVYTKPWAVELLLDLAGYTEDRDLGDCLAIEPATGEGAFLLPMVERLLRSLSAHNRPLASANNSLLAYQPHLILTCIEVRPEALHESPQEKNEIILALG